ncbi:hypothetical protein Tco_0551567 [Tanacetum coccineum]
MEQYLTLTRGNQAPGVVKPEIGGNVNLEIKSHFMRELREDTFSWNKNDDAHEHVERVLDIVSLFNIPGVTRCTHALHSSSSFEGIDAIVSKLDSLGRDMKKLKENVQAIQVGCQTCGGSHLNKECPLNKETKSMKEVKYGEYKRPFQNYSRNDERFNRGVAGYNSHDQPSLGFSYDEKQETKESGDNEGIVTIDITPNIEHACQEEKQDVRYYVDPYERLILFPRRLEHHAEEELVHETMESLKKIKRN